MQRGNENRLRRSPAYSPCFSSVMSRHGQHEPGAAHHARLGRLMLAEMDAVGAPPQGARRRSCKNDNQPARRSNAFKPSQQTPALGVRQGVVA